LRCIKTALLDDDLDTYMTANFDHIVDEARDDRLLLPHFKSWLNVALQEDRPFFAQMYLYNGHAPFVTNHNSTIVNNYGAVFGSYETFDETLEGLFQILEESGQLNNTIVVGSSDHGESIGRMGPGMNFKRNVYWDQHILHALSYMYVPHLVFASEKEKTTLMHNTDEVVSTLDMFYTLQHFLTRDGHDETTLLDKNDYRHCLPGIDLLGKRAPANRVAVSLNSITSSLPEDKRKLASFSTKTEALFLRFRWPKGDNGMSRIEFKTNYHENPMEAFVYPLNQEDTARWRKIIDMISKDTNTTKQLFDLDIMSNMKSSFAANEAS
jgi:hypothetical protein